MNYGRVYDEFITDRAGKQPSALEYFEEHHIFPRCLGGGNEQANLIRLAPEDHYFAHLVLALLHNRRDLWAACLLMNTGRKAETYRYRRSYGMIRRRWNDQSQGLGAPNADLAEYSFFHESGREFVGTRIDFGAEAKVPEASVNTLVRGRHTIVYGWAMSRETLAAAPAEKKARAVSSGRRLAGFTRRPDLMCFYHRESGRSVLATQKGMVTLGHLDKAKVSALCLGQRASSNGWCLIENEAWAYATKAAENNPHYSQIAYVFENAVTGEKRSATTFQMGADLNGGDSRPFGEIASGRKGGWKGWQLAGAPRRARILGQRHTLRHQVTGAMISGTQRELCQAIGVTAMAISRVVNDRAKKTKGWALIGAH